MNYINQPSHQLTAIDADAIRKVVLHGDLSSLSPQQKDNYYMNVCHTVGLNPLTKPFDFIKFQGKEVMYANKGCAEQLRMIHKIGLKVVAKERVDDVFVVTTEAITPDGRVDSSTGAVPIAGLKGNDLANAMMKAETKSKRRVTLSICGLNMLDETEIETIKDAEPVKTENQDGEEGSPVPAGNDPQSRSSSPDYGDYVSPVGSSEVKGKRLKEIDAIRIDGTMEYFENSARDKGQRLTGKVKEFHETATAYLKQINYQRREKYKPQSKNK